MDWNTYPGMSNSSPSSSKPSWGKTLAHMSSSFLENKEPKFKPHVGRMFYLKKVKNIEAYSVPYPGYGDGRHVLDRKKDMSSIVMVLDESNTRVMITVLDGVALWISKSCLGNEFKNKMNTRRDTLDELILDLASLANSFKEDPKVEGKATVEKKEVSDRLLDFLNRLRTFNDDNSTPQR